MKKRNKREKAKAESVVTEPPSEAPIPPEPAPPQQPPPIEGIFDDIGEPTIAVPYDVSGAATVPSVTPSCVELSKDNLPVFGAQPVPACPVVCQPSRGRNNRRQRRAMQKSLKPNAKSTWFAFAFPQLTIGFDKRAVQHQSC